MKFVALAVLSFLVSSNAVAKWYTTASCKASVTTDDHTRYEINVSKSPTLPSYYAERIEGFQIGLHLNMDQTAVDLSNLQIETEKGTTRLESHGSATVREDDGYVGVTHILRLTDNETGTKRNLVFSMGCILKE